MERVISNGKEAKDTILKLLEEATIDIKLAMAYFTDKDIANILVKKSRSLKISCIISDEDVNAEVISSLQSKVKTIIAPRKGFGMMHHKFCIIDNKTLIHGSYNFTYNAARNNSESLNISDSYKLIKDYEEIFLNMQKDIETNNGTGNPTDKSRAATKSLTNDNYLENFTEELKNHVSQIFDNYNEQEIVSLGKQRAEETTADESVFINYLDSVLEDVKSILYRDDHTKTIIKTKLKSSYDRAIENIEKEQEEGVLLLEKEKNNNEEYKKTSLININEKRKAIQSELHDMNQRINQINSDKKEYQDEIDNLDIQIKTKKFWTFPTFLKGTFLIILGFYLSFFFASAIWKIFFEESVIMDLLSRGITPQTPPLFDANALTKTFANKGGFFGILGAVFFVVPVLLTSIKLIVPNNKFFEIFFGWIIGVFIIDVVVAILISQHTFEIENLVVGGSDEWSIKEALKSGEFWLIFIFGSLPLFLTKFIIESISNAYNWSNPELVDKERFLKKQQLKRKISELELELENLQLIQEQIQSKFDEIDLEKEELEKELLEIKDKFNQKELQLEEKAIERKKNIREIYNSFLASVDSGGKKFLQNLTNGRITAYKQGWLLFLNGYFAPLEVQKRANRIQLIHDQWIEKNFS